MTLADPIAVKFERHQRQWLRDEVRSRKKRGRRRDVACLAAVIRELIQEGIDRRTTDDRVGSHDSLS